MEQQEELIAALLHHHFEIHLPVSGLLRAHDDSGDLF
jgi:hypothetical protein